MWGKLHIFRVESLSTLSLVTLPALPIQIMQITCMYTQIPLRLTDFSTVEASKTGFSIVFGHQNERFMSGYVVQNYDCMITYVFPHEVLLVFYYTPGGNPDGADFAPGFGGVVFQSITYVSDNPCRSRSRKKAGLDYTLFIHYKLTIFGEHIFFTVTHLYCFQLWLQSFSRLAAERKANLVKSDLIQLLPVKSRANSLY